MPTALIADDEEAPRQQLATALASAWPGLDIVAMAGNGVDAWDAYLEHEPAICFLDVRMPGMTGLEVRPPHRWCRPRRLRHRLRRPRAGRLRCGRRRLPHEAGRRNAPGAHRRPPSGPDARLEPPALRELLGRLPEKTRLPPALTTIQAGVGKEVRMIPIDEVVFFESDARYTRVVHRGGEALIRTALKELLARLDPERFWQVHRSIIVDRRAIASAIRQDDATMVLTLRGRSERLPVSRHFQGLFRGQ